MLLILFHDSEYCNNIHENYYTYGHSWDSNSSSAGQDISAVTELKVLLPCSKQPTSGPSLEGVESSPYSHSIYLKSSLLLYCHLHVGLGRGLFICNLLTKTLYTFLVCLVRALSPVPSSFI